MVVSKNLLILSFLIVFSSAVSAQTKEASFHFKDKSLSQALQEIADKYEVYLSFNPKLFRQEPTITTDIKNKKLAEALNILLQPRFEFKIIEDYVVITRAPEVKKASIPQKQVVYDTIRVEEKIVIYDTLKTHITVYDTVMIKKSKHVYDTVRIEKKVDLSNQKWKYSIYASPNVWFTNEKEHKVFKGIATGFQASYSLKNLTLNAALEYNFLLRNIQYTTSEMKTDTRIDTLSTYYIVEDGERVPVYITDTTRTQYESIQNIDRADNAQRISMALSLGYVVKRGKISMEVSGGLLYARVFRDEEKGSNTVKDNDAVTTQNQPYQLDASLDLRIYFNTFRESKLYAAPYLQYGISNNSTFKRYAAGLRLGIIF
ncbi:STN domain-containing protein [Fulvivirga sediminis]|uniref:STN domain-containing protein n=1 Tax=Fulvivirga sediminis TaxID=2803949 RepID=A0A937K157_9BACT|nr:STN domain-containing protein [Fulvivirga sediminis]MBL3656307.1 STN domain-containing protein [Fulvivirga sediminis]